MKNSTALSRKNFLAGSAGIMAAPLILPLGVYGAEQALRIGLIGCGRMGRSNIMSVFGRGDKENVLITALADVDANRANKLKKELERKYAGRGRKLKSRSIRIATSFCLHQVLMAL
ncbi:Gfo/Idh/MocA family oxidoreductase [Pontiella sulfatireligans]|uniref:Gfo/Idh/MocA-like oxidoreductase N-terminal domain-containing protein n=1 Tax=Pontiella sulfatireligans TaxID=2750658 RepID=A0A6C2UUV5_9BACT|nr:hypothetical protein [Pontiella sulfatireligans]VGO22636.1 hypothetical protein SCARR_04721 [Pontiella sulfatireligans]